MASENAILNATEAELCRPLLLDFEPKLSCLSISRGIAFVVVFFPRILDFAF